MSQGQYSLPGDTLSVLAVVATTTGYAWGAAPLSFEYEKGQPVAGQANGVRVHQAEIGPVAGRVYVYVTFEMIPQDPIPYVDDQPQGWQFITLGQTAEDRFVPAVRLVCVIVPARRGATLEKCGNVFRRGS